MGPEPQLIAGKYRVEGILGEGGMGVVHAAVNIYSGQRVALKQISVSAREGHALTDRLLKESKALARLDHPNVVRLLDCGRTDRGDLYIAMELVEGEPLRALIRGAKRQGRLLPLDLVLTVAAQAAEAMEFAHEKGIYHRDLKPENLIVSPGGRAKVVDFGLAKSAAAGDLPIAGAKPLSPTNPANVVGTPRYMAPEQVRGLKVDARTDIYALGVTLYEGISGRTPYDVYEDGATVTELMGHHVFADPTPVREHVPSCPDSVWNILHRCLAKAPEDRYARMRDLARDLRAALDESNGQGAESAREVGAAAAPPPDSTAAPRAARETEPMPPPVSSRSLPFVKRPEDPAPAPREARETEPMPPSFTPAGSALPFVAPARRPLLGVGHTQPLRSASALLSDARVAAAAGTSRSALPPPPPSTPPAPSSALPVPVGPRDSGDGGVRSGPGFAFDSTQPGTLAQPFAPRPSPPVRIPAPSARRMKPSAYILPSLTGMVLAVAAMLAVMRLHDASRQPPRPVVVPAASIEPPEPEAKPSATVEPPLLPPPAADAPVDLPAAAPSGASSGAVVPVAVKASVPAGSARRPASTSSPPGRPRAAPAPARPAAPPPPKNAPNRLFGNEP
jgi:serine/threonine-protein kinase